jgi:hypothetical protein
MVMNKQTLIIGMLSITIITLPALFFALAGAFFVGHFWAWFFLSSGMVYIIGQISNQFLTKKMNADLLKLTTRLTEVTNQQNVEVSCAYCKVRNITPVFLSQRNTFECKTCKQQNLIIFQFAAAQITVPLESPQLGTISNLINETK